MSCYGQRLYRSSNEILFEELPPWFDSSDAQLRIDPSPDLLFGVVRLTFRVSVGARMLLSY